MQQLACVWVGQASDLLTSYVNHFQNDIDLVMEMLKESHRLKQQITDVMQQLACVGIINQPLTHVQDNFVRRPT